MKQKIQITLGSLLLCSTFGVQAQENHKHTLDANGNRAGHSTSSPKVATATKSVGKTAPSFWTKDSHGKPVSLQELKQKPLVLVFIEKGCPCCKSGKPYFDRIQRIYGDVANVVGVVYGDTKLAKDWAQETKPKFRVLADPKGQIAKSYGATVGLEARIVGTNGKIALSYAGYSAPMLSEVTAYITKVTKVRGRKMDTIPAPKELTSGCELGSDSRSGGKK